MRRFVDAPTTSGLPPTADIRQLQRYVGFCQQRKSARSLIDESTEPQAMGGGARTVFAFSTPASYSTLDRLF